MWRFIFVKLERVDDSLLLPSFFVSPTQRLACISSLMGAQGSKASAPNRNQQPAYVDYYQVLQVSEEATADEIKVEACFFNPT